MSHNENQSLQPENATKPAVEMVSFSGKIPKDQKDLFKKWRVAQGCTTDGEGYRKMFNEKFGKPQMAEAI